MAITDRVLMEIHDELLETLELAHGKPLFITISYYDEATDKKEHKILQNNGFSYEDMEKTLTHLQDEVKKNFDPHSQQIAGKLHRQFRARKPKLEIVSRG